MKEWIRLGEWAPGSRIPAEVELVDRLKVSRGTLRSAIKQLEGEGLLLELPGRGRKARGRVVASSADVGGVRRQVGGANGVGPGVMARTVMLLTDLSLAGRPAGPQYHDVAVDTAAVQEAHQAGLHVLSYHAANLGLEDADQFLAGLPRGVAAMHRASHSARGLSLLNRLASAGVPVVAYGSGQETEPFDRVYSDHEAGAYELARWLAGRGCRRILHAGFDTPTRYWLDARHRGYARALGEAGLDRMPTLEVPDAFPRDSGDITRANFDQRVKLMAGHLAGPLLSGEPADAVMAHNDVDATVVAAGCRLLGRDPERDVTIVGYDHWTEMEEHQWEPSRPAATVDKQNDLIGRTMIRVLIRRLDSSASRDAVRSHPLTPRLVVRDSSLANGEMH